MAVTQSNRGARLTTELGDDVLLFSEMNGSEQLSRPFHFELELLSRQSDIDVDQLLGKPAHVTLDLPKQGTTRVFHGLVTEFAQVGYTRRFHEYRATLRPWWWLLTRTSDCRIFQDKSVPDIFEAVVKQYGFTNYKLDLRASYTPWEYCVQYRETDFNFLSRLLEHEGIYYYFQHSTSSHDMVLVDDPAAHAPVEDYASVPYYPPGTDNQRRERDHLAQWTFAKSVQPGCYATTDYDFEKPRSSLTGKSSIVSAYAQSDFEMFDYPGELQAMSASESERVAKLRIGELHAGERVASGSGDAAGLACGARFTLTNHPRADLNIDYLIVNTQISLSNDAYRSGDRAGPDFSVTIEALDAKTPYRPPRITPKPIIHGTQTAVVVGKAGEEIWTDQYGRVKVQFHWDRYGQSDENSSCWIRVAHAWGGDQWGGIHLPRIGQEVIVSFLEGDPDDPIITGCVYNGANMPPYTLPDNQTQSGFKTRSTKGGTADNYNEIRFEDKKGQEELHVQAEKNLTLHVKNDATSQIDHDESVTINHDRTSSIGNDETHTVSKDRSTTISGKDTLTVSQDLSESISGNHSSTVGKQFQLTASDEITLTTGSSQLVMKSDGTITISGVSLTIQGSSGISVSGGQKVELSTLQLKASATQVQVEGTQTAIKGAMLQLQASGIASIQGSLTKIN
jgi:type VI secretion system secreted protein VgrG